MCFKRKDEIRYNYKSHHFGVVKKKKRKELTSVFMTTKNKSEGKDNIPMEQNANPNDNRDSFFMARVRTYNKGSYGPKQKTFSLTKKDRAKANEIYAVHKKNAKAMKRQKK